MQSLYKIKDKQKRIINLKFNDAQWQIVKDIAHQNPIRHFAIKTRQIGISTFWLLWWLDEAIFEENVNCGILAHKWDSLVHLWSIIELAYRSFPEQLELKQESARALEFVHNNSKIFVSLSIRSTAVHNLHISEWCLCKDEEVKASMGATSKYTNISGESTGNGIGNDGYETYQDARMGNNEFTPRFIAWFLHNEYTLPLKDMSEASIMRGLSEEERRLQKLMKRDYNQDIQPGQVLFRRQMKRKLKNMFPSEYPETEEDAFITSGEHFFNLKKIIELSKEAKEWIDKENYYERGDDYICFEEPNKRDVFVAGADTSEGSNDNSALKIINVTKRREAFTYKAKCGYKKFYKICDHWCRKYNNALLAVEDNNTGHAVLLGLEENCKYPNLYQESNVTRIIKDSKKIKTKLGWHTDKFSRPAMLADLRLGIEDDEDVEITDFLPEITFYDTHLFTELYNFVRISKDRYEALEGKTDDTIFATAIAFQLYLKNKTTKSTIKTTEKGVLIGKQREAKV
jgi:hypothetical protein